MRICGIEFKGSEARLAVIECDEGISNYVITETKKIPLTDGECNIQTKSFQETFESFCRDNDINKVCIKKRNKKGEFAGGPDTFKMEGIIQVSSAPNVTLISPQTIAAMKKREKIELPEELNKYQHEAHLTALSGAE